MSDESTPEERLRKYKKQLEEMAREEGRELKRKEVTREGPKQTVKPERPSPTLESPAKRELRESSATTGAGPTDSDRRGFKERMMMAARERAIQSSLRDLRERKEGLELLYKRKLIDRREFEKRKKELTDEGQSLLREKAEIDKELSG